MRHWSVWIGTGFLILSCSLATSAQDVSISGPSIGFVSDERGSTIWPLLGILGASVPGEALPLPESIAHAAISPRHNYAIAISVESGQPIIVDLEAATSAGVLLAGARANPSLIAMSPTGAAAALYERESGMLQLVAGLPANPRIESEFDTSSFGGEVRDVAVSDDGKVALVNVGNESRTLWVIDARNIASPVPVTQPSRMTFITHRYDAVIADEAMHEAVLIKDLDFNPVREPGIVMREEGRPISAVGASVDGQTIFVAQEDSEEVTITNLQDRTTTIVPCRCRPTAFVPLKGAAIFRLNGPGTGPITVLDASSPTPRTLIIPMDPDALARRSGRDQ